MDDIAGLALTVLVGTFLLLMLVRIVKFGARTVDGEQQRKQLPAQFCRACGKPTTPPANFCRTCGADLR